jgi:Berberine and berberine like
LIINCPASGDGPEGDSLKSLRENSINPNHEWVAQVSPLRPGGHADGPNYEFLQRVKKKYDPNNVDSRLRRDGDEPQTLSADGG